MHRVGVGSTHRQETETVIETERGTERGVKAKKQAFARLGMRLPPHFQLKVMGLINICLERGLREDRDSLRRFL